MSEKGSGSKVAMGCGIGCLVVLIIAIVVAIIAVKAVKGKVAELAAEYTSDAAMVIDPPQATDAEIQDAISRFDNFRNSLTAGEEVGPLVLSDQDINILLFHHPLFSDVAGMTRVKIEENRFSGKVSLELDKFPIPFFKDILAGRFFNGDASFTPGLSDGRMSLYLEDLTVNGKSIPEEIINEIRKENLLQDADLESDPNVRELLDLVDEIKIEDNKLHIIPKPKTAE